jgi:ammonia channel protein AmtB
MGFVDNGGASVVHLMGGLAGFMGTYLIGPRTGRFKADKELAFVLDDEGLFNDDLNEAIDAFGEKKKAKEKD